MRFSQPQLTRIAEMILKNWKTNNVVIFKAEERQVLDSAVKALMKELQKEADLDKEVQKMLDDLERSNSGQFQRHKMAGLLKQKLAKEKKVVL